MTAVLVAAAALAVGTYAMRRGGVALGGRVGEGPRAQAAERTLDHAVVALLIGVTLTAAVYDGGAPAGWARPLGVGCALVAAWLRAPLAISILLGAGVTALLRAIGLS
ncbi:AzlD domain-containing protein [Litorihabitans aurantiacus]|uniref:AzlD domain-containing protein n=1 Tax=Litorihabitans aurantiacus TaxID=1930061 RepID=A0AA38CVD0_9MICO|nr:AzlD domain-containing protein [Litorihabitans aurantiacus]GMA33369.1 hypothetical protein GCM10025875_33610 [Litorihabitans aurantiacus]